MGEAPCFAHFLNEHGEMPDPPTIRLQRKTDKLKELGEVACDRPLVLMYGARDCEHNQAVVLEDVLEEGIGNS
jgi:uncharacterized protein YeaO (DUF488 family)